ncbi:hypothetical protein N0V83_002039 [Neocucurbitaria cava]|uniref:Cellobiose dehydrogenase-like cytochrome domain-containing protein n=1 Tax=Neocucurbitaria cava TaxID=798079 RepID=A0A9W9CPP2_9PLEO|nr:hypothetical protein N0V83_002039 [Neocucurbitaria cava]
MPNFNGDAQVELLEGSGVSNGTMAANVKCSNCDSWSGGTADFTASECNWIYASQSSGGPKGSDDMSASIRQHNAEAAFLWDYTNAKGGDSVNPFMAAIPSSTPVETTGTSAGVSTTPPTSLSTSPSTPAPTQPPSQNDSRSSGKNAGISVGVVLAALLVGITVWLYMSWRRKKLSAQADMPPELPPNEKSGLKRYLGGRWRAEADGSSKPVEIDSRTVNRIPGPPFELDATGISR